MKEKTVSEMSETIERILTYGIDLGDLGKSESLKYLLSLSDYINKNTINNSVYEDGKLLIETIGFDPIVALRIRRGTLEFLPLTDNNFFDSFLKILEFVSQKKLEEEFEGFIDELEESEVKEDDSEFDWV